MSEDNNSANINEAAYAALRERIVSGELQPGTPLSERALCEALEVSRTPLREAIKMLAREGLVEISATRRAKVASVTLDEAANMLTLLAALEAYLESRPVRKFQVQTLQNWIPYRRPCA